MTDIAADPVRPDAPPPPAWGGSLLQTPAAKVALIVCLLLLMQVPLMMVSGLIREREERQNEVLAGFRRGWGPEQTVVGPMLMVPYTASGTSAQAADGGRRLRGWARLPASQLHVVATLRPETRRRGLFHAIVYTAAVDFSGTITARALNIKDAPDAVVDWAGAQVVIGARDLRGVSPDASIDWNGAPVPLQASDGDGCGLAFLAAPANLHGEPATGSSIAFKAGLSLRGTQTFRLVPAGRQIDMRVTSSWPTPSFAGATLPLRYDLRPDGFDAQWDMAGDPDSSAWQLTRECGATVNAIWTDIDAQVGVQLQEALPTYLLVDRAAKYDVFFLALTYLTLFLFEALSGVRIHLVQYGMVGVSVSLFPLLLISIGEPIGFTASYAISAAAVLAQASLYTLSVVRQRRLAAVFAGVLCTLFAFLYVVLNLDSYALLAGTVALFNALSLVMLATRRVNWAAAPAGP